MIWNKKRIKSMQIYKEKKDGFLIAFFYPEHNPEVFCGVQENPRPSYQDFCHSSASYDFLAQNCYPVSQRQLKKYPDWYAFFDNYLKNVFGLK